MLGFDLKRWTVRKNTVKISEISAQELSSLKETNKPKCIYINVFTYGHRIERTTLKAKIIKKSVVHPLTKRIFARQFQKWFFLPKVGVAFLFDFSLYLWHLRSDLNVWYINVFVSKKIAAEVDVLNFLKPSAIFYLKNE